MAESVLAAPGGCCTTLHSRQVLEGGDVLLLTRHQVRCPVWSAR
ncbi:hypothetical protein [Kitasatospora sp. NPDC057223]